MPPGVNIGDSGPGYLSVMGIVAALYRRETTGVGQRIEVTMQESIISFARGSWEQYRAKTAAPSAGNGMSLDTMEITNEPYLRKRGIISEVEHPYHGKVPIPGFPVRM